MGIYHPCCRSWMTSSLREMPFSSSLTTALSYSNVIVGSPYRSRALWASLVALATLFMLALESNLLIKPTSLIGNGTESNNVHGLREREQKVGTTYLTSLQRFKLTCGVGHLIARSIRLMAPVPLLLSHHVISQLPDAADFYLDGVAGEHVAVGALGAHPDDIAGVEGGVVA